MPTLINRFDYEWAFLSNFYPCSVVYEGVEYASLEHAYQAAKTLNLEKRKVFSLADNPNLHPSQAKRIGRGLEKQGLQREDWKQVNEDIMLELLQQKFTGSIMRRKLLATFNAYLIEGNWWHDTFWGVCMGKLEGHVCRHGEHEPVGDNRLGHGLMAIRSVISGIPMPKPPQLGTEK